MRENFNVGFHFENHNGSLQLFDNDNLVVDDYNKFIKSGGRVSIGFDKHKEIIASSVINDRVFNGQIWGIHSPLDLKPGQKVKDGVHRSTYRSADGELRVAHVTTKDNVIVGFESKDSEGKLITDVTFEGIVFERSLVVTPGSEEEFTISRLEIDHDNEIGETNFEDQGQKGTILENVIIPTDGADGRERIRVNLLFKGTGKDRVLQDVEITDRFIEQELDLDELGNRNGDKIDETTAKLVANHGGLADGAASKKPGGVSDGDQLAIASENEEDTDQIDSVTAETADTTFDDPRPRDKIIEDGKRKVQQMLDLIERSNDPLMERLRDKNGVTIEFNSKLKDHDGNSAAGNTPRDRVDPTTGKPIVQLNPLILGNVNLPLAFVLKTILHELSHADMQRLIRNALNITDPNEKAILQRIIDIRLSRIEKGIVVVDRFDSEGNITTVPLEGFENVTTAEDLEDLQEEYEHIVLVEKYAEDQAESVKSTVESDPDTFGTILAPDLTKDEKSKKDAFRAVALGREATKSYYKTLFEEKTPSRPSGEFIRKRASEIRSNLLKK